METAIREKFETHLLFWFDEKRYLFVLWTIPCSNRLSALDKFFFQGHILFWHDDFCSRTENDDDDDVVLRKHSVEDV